MTEFPATNVIRLARRGIAVEVVIDDPATRNAMSERLLSDLEAVLNATEGDGDCRALVLKGANAAFCAGADLKNVGKATAEDPAFPGKSPAWLLNRRGGLLYDRLNRHPMLVVAVVDGAAIGGGFGLVCCADIVICTDRARFSLSETTLGLCPAQIAPFVIARLGLPVARRLSLTGVRFGAQVALLLGLADYHVPDSDAAEIVLTEILNQVDRCGPRANAVTKALLFEAARGRSDYAAYAADLFADCMASDEGREGTSAFIEKRAPKWIEKSL